MSRLLTFSFSASVVLAFHYFSSLGNNVGIGRVNDEMLDSIETLIRDEPVSSIRESNARLRTMLPGAPHVCDGAIRVAVKKEARSVSRANPKADDHRQLRRHVRRTSGICCKIHSRPPAPRIGFHRRDRHESLAVKDEGVVSPR